MTSNQIAYLRHLEDVRSHQASEQLGRDRLAEDARSNLEQERQGRDKLWDADEDRKLKYKQHELDERKHGLDEREHTLKSHTNVSDQTRKWMDSLAKLAGSAIGEAMNSVFTFDDLF